MYSGINGQRQQHGQRPDATQLAEDLFSQLDTSNKGYLEKSDFTSAFDTVDSTSASSGVSVDDVFSALDTDADGKVTQDEMTSSLKKLAEELDSQFNAMRMGGMPPPPPPEASDDGLSEDELTSIAESTTDSALAEAINNLVSNFDSADTDGDGKISVQEAMAYQASQDTSSTTTTRATEDTGFTQDELSAIASSTSDSRLAELMNTLANDFSNADSNGDGRVTHDEAMAYQASQEDSETTTTTTVASSSDNTEAAIMRRILDLMRAYASTDGDTTSTLTASA
jgi:Ca2+-binding EF-hand superfamily protein